MRTSIILVIGFGAIALAITEPNNLNKGGKRHDGDHDSDPVDPTLSSILAQITSLEAKIQPASNGATESDTVGLQLSFLVAAADSLLEGYYTADNGDVFPLDLASETGALGIVADTAEMAGMSMAAATTTVTTKMTGTTTKTSAVSTKTMTSGAAIGTGTSTSKATAPTNAATAGIMGVLGYLGLAFAL